MTLCQDDAALVGQVSLFCGIETAKWGTQDFLSLADFCKQHGVRTLFVKVFQVGSDEGDFWYGGEQAWDNIYQELQQQVNVIPYGYSYMLDLQKDEAICKYILQKYGKLCLDLEGQQWEGQSGFTYAQALCNVLSPIPGKVWLSHPADFESNNQSPFMQAIAPCVNVFMPMCYSDHLTAVYKAQLATINANACVQPTLDDSTEFGPNNFLGNASIVKNNGGLAVSVWYEGFAKQNPQVLDQLVQMFGGVVQQGGDVRKNPDGSIATCPHWYQLSEGEMNLCGPASAVEVAFAVAPGSQEKETPEDVDAITDQLLKDVFGVSDPKAFGGVDTWTHDMYNILMYLRNKLNTFHFVEVSTMEQIDEAVRSGYPCLFGCNEADITAVLPDGTTEHAYPWHISAGHIPGPVVGLDKNDNWMCDDPLNNNFQGTNATPVYLRSDIAKSFTGGAVIQLTQWLQPIPDVNHWPPNFNGQEIPTVAPQVTQLDLSKAVVLGQTTVTQAGTKVAHGLGAVPKVVIPLLDGAYSENAVITVDYGSMDADTFTAHSSVSSVGNVRFLVL